LKAIAMAVATALLAGALTACSSAPAKPAAPTNPTPATLTKAVGAEICTDLNSWIVQADNQDMPRLPASWTITSVNTVNLNSTQVGQDLDSEASDLEQDNSDALNPSVASNETGTSNTTALSSDCAAYGVTLNWNPS
jgi:hypothetical protein